MPSLFAQLTALLPAVQNSAGEVLASAFLAVCQEFVHVIEKLGTGFALVRSDVGGNIDRLKAAQAKDVDNFITLFSIILAEIGRKEQEGSSSDTNGLLWLKRALEFTCSLLLRLYEDRQVTLSTAASEVYTATLYQYHTWYTSAAFTVALKLVPSREAFFDKFGTPNEELMAEMKTFVDQFAPVLRQIHEFLASHNLNFPTRV